MNFPANVWYNIGYIIKEHNTSNHTLVKAENRTTRRIPDHTGIRQGDSLSPILFNITMDEIITNTKQNGRGYRMENSEIKIMCYAEGAGRC